METTDSVAAIGSHLAALSSLQCLNLGGKRINEDGAALVHQLAALLFLQNLDLGADCISDDGASTFRLTHSTASRVDTATSMSST
jgi:hypothetical protein